MSDLNKVHNDGQKVNLLKPGGKISRRELLKLASPFGKVTLDDSKCTGCGICANDCPTEALTILSGEETDVYRLLFKHNLCTACGKCVEICPEECLRLERTLEMDKMGSHAEVLFEDKVARCAQCGGIIGSKAMLSRLKSRMPEMDESLSSRFELCPVCKIKGWG